MRLALSKGSPASRSSWPSLAPGVEASSPGGRSAVLSFDAGLLHHDALGRPRHLPHQHKSGGLQPSAVARAHRFTAGDDASSAQVFAQEGDGVSPQGQSDMAVILDHLAAGRHRSQRDTGFVNLGHQLIFAGRRGGEQRQWLIAQRLSPSPIRSFGLFPVTSLPAKSSTMNSARS
jgi:hypothetical protein